MPTYLYKCQSCGIELEEYQRVADDPLEKCPACKKNKLKRMITAPILTLTSEPKTVGMLAEKNARSISSDQRKKMLEEYKTKKIINRFPEGSINGTPMKREEGEIPDWMKQSRTKKTNEVAKMSNDKIQKYINTGE
jgi:putative FmdB family regulatory protein